MTSADVVVWVTRPEPIEVTASTIGIQLSGDTDDKQAAILLAFAKDVQDWDAQHRAGYSWPSQCRMIAERFTDGECRTVARVLGMLVEHLRDVPAERAARNDGG